MEQWCGKPMMLSLGRIPERSINTWEIQAQFRSKIKPAIPTNSHAGRWVSTNHWLFRGFHKWSYPQMNGFFGGKWQENCLKMDDDTPGTPIKMDRRGTSPEPARHLWRRPPCRSTRWRWWRRSRAHKRSSRRSRTWMPKITTLLFGAIRSWDNMAGQDLYSNYMYVYIYVYMYIDVCIYIYT